MSTHTYSPWRHGGWYVGDVRYPSGACGCVSRNFADRKWRIACDPRPFAEQPTFPNRDAAADAEQALLDDGKRKYCNRCQHQPENISDVYRNPGHPCRGCFNYSTFSQLTQQ